MCFNRTLISDAIRDAACYKFCTACEAFPIEDVAYFQAFRPDVLRKMVQFVEVWVTETSCHGDCFRVHRYDTMEDACKELQRSDFYAELIYNKALTGIYVIRW